MIVNVKIVADKEKEEERRIEVPGGYAYENILEKLGINPVEVIVLREGKPVPEDEKVAVSKNKEEIRITIVQIVSSG